MKYIKMYQDINNLFISTNESKILVSKFEEVSENFNKLIPKDWEIKSDKINHQLRRPGNTVVNVSKYAKSALV